MWLNFTMHMHTYILLNTFLTGDNSGDININGAPGKYLRITVAI